MEALHIHYSVQETECCRVSGDLWVIAQRELTLDYEGCDRSPLHFLLLRPQSFNVYLCVHLSIRHHTETPGSYHGWGVVRRFQWRGVLCRCGQNDRRSGASPVSRQRLTTRQPWPVEESFTCYSPRGTAVGFTRRAQWGMQQAKRGGVDSVEFGGWGDWGVGWPADNTWRETDRFDMWTCPHLCSEKGTPATALPQTEPVSTVTPRHLKSNTHQREFQQCT